MKCKDQETCWHDPICTSFEKSTVTDKTEREKLVEQIDGLLYTYSHVRHSGKGDAEEIISLCESHFEPKHRREHREIALASVDKVNVQSMTHDSALSMKGIALTNINEALSDD